MQTDERAELEWEFGIYHCNNTSCESCRFRHSFTCVAPAFASGEEIEAMREAIAKGKSRTETAGSEDGA